MIDLFKLSGTARIPHKLYLKLTDLQVADFEQRTQNSVKKLIEFQEQIGWPWGASQLQIEDWDSWITNLT